MPIRSREEYLSRAKAAADAAGKRAGNCGRDMFVRAHIQIDRTFDIVTANRPTRFRSVVR